MYKGYQEELFKNPWGCNQGFSTLNNKLNDLLPVEGRVENPNSKNKNLDKFRRAQNAPTICPTMVFVTNEDFLKLSLVLPTMRDTYYATSMTWKCWEDRVEEVLTPNLEAAKEQGIK